MALAAGSRLGVYEVISLLGAGGMGEVYRAKDTTLKREVALKLLPAELAHNPERAARLQREAELLAALNHPNIAHLYGLESASGTLALVMELVEGETLADRIARGPIPLDEALPIAKQIANALEAAHDQGIVHRDLKPANIKVRDDSTVKVLDFGLAKAMEPLASGVARAVLSDSPTITSPALVTGVGVLLGTAAYMSPEQAKGRPADKRSDIWAFGCVLFEMLTGTPPFAAEDVAETLAAILTTAPDWTMLPAPTPEPVRRVLRRCLERDRTSRPGDASALRLDLDDALISREQSSISAQAQPRSWRAQYVPLAIVTVLLLIVITLWLVRLPREGSVAVVSQVSPTWLALTAPADKPIFLSGLHRSAVITRDGTRVVYVTRDGLAVRSLSAPMVSVLAGTGESRAPFISQDGLRLGFAGDNNTLYVMPLAGGPRQRVADIGGGFRGGALLGSGGVIYSSGNARGLLRVATPGAEPERLTTIDTSTGERQHAWPIVLPNEHAVLFTVAFGSGTSQTYQLAALDLQTGRHRILTSGTQPTYLADGRVLFVADGRLMQAPFDAERLELTAAPTQVLGQVATVQNGAAEYSVSDTGTIVYVSSGAVTPLRSLVWKSRDGQETPVNAPPQAYTYPRVSPDGMRIALDIRDSDAGNISIYDLRRAVLRRLTIAGAEGQYPVWFPDGRRVMFSASVDGCSRLIAQDVDGAGSPAQFTDGTSGCAQPFSIAPDARSVVTRLDDANPGMARMSLKENAPLEPLLRSGTATMINGEISPDGRYLAFQSNETGRFEIYVVPFPDVKRARWQISTQGGSRPVWARRGRELFFLDPGGAVMRVETPSGASFTAGTPQKLFDGVSVLAGFPPGRNYDVAADGRFLMIKDRYLDPTMRPIELTVVLNGVSR